jgi:predicted nucleic acid-binding protein
MIVITDSNIIISALIKPNGTVAKVFKSKSQIQFYAPSFLKDEIENHFSKIVQLSDLTKKEVQAELTFYFKRIKFIDISNIPKKYILEAFDIVADIDPDDVFFVALSRFKKHRLWTSDKVLIKGLEKKGYNICITTKEIKSNLYKK